MKIKNERKEKAKKKFIYFLNFKTFLNRNTLLMHERHEPNYFVAHYSSFGGTQTIILLRFVN